MKIKFGRGVEKQSRAQSKFLFCFVIIDLLKYCLNVVPIEPINAKVSEAVIRIFSDLKSEAAKCLSDCALDIIDEYLSQAGDESFVNEESYKASNNDLNAFLKNENLGKKEKGYRLYAT